MMRSRLIDVAYSAISQTIALFIGCGILYGLHEAFLRVPCWLGHITPAVVAEGADEISRDARHACFAIHFHKVAGGRPLRPVFHLETAGGGYSPPIGISVHRIDEHGQRVDSPPPEHPVSARWDSRYCFEPPGTVAAADSMTVSGMLIHQRWGWITVEEPIPTFTIEALK